MSATRAGSMRPPSRAATQEPDHIGDESTTSNGRRKARPEVSRKVIHQSFAYGAPSDGKTKTKPRSGRKSQESLEDERSVSPEKVEEQEEAVEDLSASQNAASRYAALKARNQTGSQKGATSGLFSAKSRGTNATPTRRSARLSAASGSVDADAPERQLEIAEIEEDPAEESQEEDEHGNVRKSSVPPPSMPSRSRMPTNGQLNSFYMRAPTRSSSPGPSDERRSQMMMTSSLLRGAQKPSQDPFSPRRGDMDSMRSSDAGDSRSYASEEAFVQRNGSTDKHDRTPPAKQVSRSWLAGLSPWNRGKANGHTNGANDDADYNPSEAEEEDEHAAGARRRPRTSQDKTYRPPKDFEDETSDDDEQGQLRKRRRSAEWNKSARGGRDDNKIWMAGKKKKGRRSGGGAVNEDGDADLTVDGSGARVAEDQSNVRGSEKSRSRSRSETTLPSNTSLWVVAAAVLALLAWAASWSPLDMATTKSGLSYKAPKSTPSDFDGFLSRLLSLESAVGSLSSTSSSLVKSHDHLAGQVSALELSSKEVKSLLAKVQQDTQSAHYHVEARLAALEEVGSQLRRQTAELDRRLVDVDARAQRGFNDGETGESAAQLQKKVQARLDALQAELKRNEAELEKVKSSVREAESVASQAKNALQPLLEANLPAQMPVRLDRTTGKPSIEPWFYEAIKGLLGSSGSLSDGSAAFADSWEAFRASNEASMRALIADEAANVIGHKSTAKGGHAVISRADFVELLGAEIEALKSRLEDTFNQNAQGLQNDILAKVRSQEQMYEEAGSHGRGKRHRGPSHTLASELLPETADLSKLSTKDGSDATQAILAVIESALEVYSADRINRADYAQYSSGGRVIPSLTSPTYDMGSPSQLGSSWLSMLPGLGRSSDAAAAHLRARSPVVALHHDNSPGMCWPLAGSTGQLGIRLARRILVSDITIEHPLSSLTFGDSSSAPREITVSALVDRPEDRQKLAEFRRKQAQREQSTESTAAAADDDFQVISAPPSTNHIHLASFTFSASSSISSSLSRRSIQTFPISAEARALAIPVSVVQVRVLSNHGEDKFTCLYRVRVHGEVWKGEEMEGE